MTKIGCFQNFHNLLSPEKRLFFIYCLLNFINSIHKYWYQLQWWSFSLLWKTWGVECKGYLFSFFWIVVVSQIWRNDIQRNDCDGYVTEKSFWFSSSLLSYIYEKTYWECFLDWFGFLLMEDWGSSIKVDQRKYLHLLLALGGYFSSRIIPGIS